MNNSTRPSIWRSKPLLLITYIVYCIVALFSLYAFGSYIFADRYGVALDQILLVRLTSAALLLATLASMVRISRIIISAARNTTPKADNHIRRAIFTSLVIIAIMVASFLFMTLWFYNLH